MRKTAAVAYETFLRLKRDRIFLPVTTAGMILFFLASAFGDWTIDALVQTYVDFSLFAFEVLGGLVAIFWGTRTIADSRQEGSLEVQLAAPISRTSWIVGKFLGLAACLTVLAGLLALAFAGCHALKYGSWPQPEAFARMALQTVGWYVIAAIAIFFSAFTSGPVAIFASLALWVTGLAAGPIARILPADTPDATRWLLTRLALYFDMNRFRGLDALDPSQALGHAMALTALQGLSLVGFLVAAACLVFEKRSLVG